MILLKEEIIKKWERSGLLDEYRHLMKIKERREKIQKIKEIIKQFIID